jgi:hypothetical protein
MFTLCNARVNVLVIVLSDSPCERIRKWEGGLSDFERGQIVGACLAGASVAKTATLLGISRATVFEVMSAYTNHGKPTENRNSRWKSTLTDRDCHALRRIVLKNQNYCSTDDSRTEYSS